MDKPFIFDRPIVIEQTFEVFLQDDKPPVFVKRKEVQRQAHNTACDVADVQVSYDCWQDVDLSTRTEAIKAVEKMVEEGKNK